MVPRFAVHVILTTLISVIVVSASPAVRVRDSPVTLSMSAQVNVNGNDAQGLVRRDTSRARFLAAGGRSESLSADDIPMGNDAIFSVVQVDVGSPPTTYNLIVDTASANVWVGAKQAYKQSSSTGTTSETFMVNYGSGSAGGTEYTDALSLGGGLTINQQSIGDANWTKGFDLFQIDGVCGVGPTILTVGKLLPSKDSPIPTIMDNLSMNGKIPAPSLGVYLTPFQAPTGGQLSWGQIDNSKCTSPPTTVDVTSSWPASAFWGLDQEVKYGDETILSSSSGIIDSGTTFIHIAPDAFQKYQSATGATMNDKLGLLELPASQYNSIKSLFFNIGGTPFELTKNGQIWPPSLNSKIGGDKDKIYLVIRPLQGLDGVSIINGFLWMQRFYVNLDSGKKQIAIANTAYTHAELN